MTIGQVDVMHVGTPDRIECVLAGDPLREIAMMMEVAQPQQVIVSNQFAQEIEKPDRQFIPEIGVFLKFL